MIVEIRSPHGQEPQTTHKAMLHGFAGNPNRVVAVCQPLDGRYLFEVEIHRLIMPEVAPPLVRHLPHRHSDD